jgi:hypothetical protein
LFPESSFSGLHSYFSWKDLLQRWHFENKVSQFSNLYRVSFFCFQKYPPPTSGPEGGGAIVWC